ncbi:NAD-dependent epimerase/dehydratase family protein [Aeromicrobium sp. Leaf350]|uniref:NAD-dependent epimerase/dehydratase family protein n=1 Tax=Aeromicrobium sp. Leaf350 TaxID=2876565 RepID=UPI001E2DD864|nr:NAD-dependent epimerase/dehydratase family protein [Aeromicrobium sp. Leaf350]
MKHLVIGAGQIGPHVARQLIAAGADATVATRSGRGPADLTTVPLDATDGTALRAALEDVDVLYLCLHASAYRDDAWKKELPPLERTVLEAAAAAGTTVVFPESLYAFDASAPVSASSRIAPRSPLGEVRKTLLAQRAASPATTVSVVAGDFIGPGVGQSHAGPRMWEPTLAGRTVRPVGHVDTVHAWTYLPDLAATMVATGARPSAPIVVAPAIHATQRELVEAYAAAGGVDLPKISPVPMGVMRAVGLVHRETRTIAQTGYLFTEPLRMDFSATRDELGVDATPLDVVAKATVAA